MLPCQGRKQLRAYQVPEVLASTSDASQPRPSLLIDKHRTQRIQLDQILQCGHRFPTTAPKVPAYGLYIARRLCKSTAVRSAPVKVTLDGGYRVCVRLIAPEIRVTTASLLPTVQTQIGMWLGLLCRFVYCRGAVIMSCISTDMSLLEHCSHTVLLLLAGMNVC